jgi:hypothetical protein
MEITCGVPDSDYENEKATTTDRTLPPQKGFICVAAFFSTATVKRGYL